MAEFVKLLQRQHIHICTLNQDPLTSLFNVLGTSLTQFFNDAVSISPVGRVEEFSSQWVCLKVMLAMTKKLLTQSACAVRCCSNLTLMLSH